MKQKIKNLFNSMEEKYVFPIGRRTWQILSFVGLFGLVIGIIWLVVNLTPTLRDSVHISKDEVKNNAVDINAVTIDSSPNCTAKEVQNYLDSIRALTPNMEWKNLGKYEEEVYYFVDEYGGLIYDYETNTYKSGIREVFQPNPTAIPNIFQSVYDNASIDSSDFCSKKDIVKISFLLLKQFDKKFISQEGTTFISEVVQWSSDLNIDQANSGIIINKISNSKIKKIFTQNDTKHLVKSIDLAKNGYSETELAESRKLISKHQSLKKAKKDIEPGDYLEIIEITGESEISDEGELENAVSDFIEDIEFYDNNGLVRSYKKYISLYAEKLNNAIQEQLNAKAEKVENRMKSLMLIGAGFLTVITIAIILLLFSIQNILKNREE
jgi:hypothetical protein